MPYAGQTTKPLVKLGASDECWEWLGSINKKTGYGKKQLAGMSLLAHRWVWESLFGPIPEGKVINHKCSNRSCVNPSHLEVVTQADNCRHGKGSTLNVEQAKEIKLAKSNKQRGTRKLLSEHYGVSPQLISDIWYGRAWKNI